MGYKIIIFAICCLLISVEGRGKVYEVRAKDEREQDLVDTLEHMYDVWRNSRKMGENTHIFVDDIKEPLLKQWLVTESISHSILVTDVDALLGQLHSKNSKEENLENTVHRMRSFRLDQYHPLDEINEWMSVMAKNNQKIVRKFTMTVSYESRPIFGLKLAAGKQYEGRPSIFLDGGFHAREWVSPSTVVYIATKLIEEYGKDPEVTKLLDTLTIYVVPVVNVDGYSYTWINQSDSEHRLWRKTRSYHDGNECIGTDPNRNFDFHFGGAGTSNDSCAETYRGPNAFSEPETVGMAKFLHSIKYLYMYLSLHSYSQVYFSPYSYSTEVPPNFNYSMELCEEAMDALYEVNQVEYPCGSVARILYACAGTSLDYASAVVGAELAFGAELRDTGDHGFLLPQDQVFPTAKENYAAFKVLANSFFK